MDFPKPVTPHISTSHKSNPFPKSLPVIVIVLFHFCQPGVKMTFYFYFSLNFPY